MPETFQVWYAAARKGGCAMAKSKCLNKTLAITPQTLEALVDFARQRDFTGKELVRFLKSVKNPEVFKLCLSNQRNAGAFAALVHQKHNERFAKAYAAISADKQMTAALLQIAQQQP